MPVRLVIVTGLSGAGKTQAIKSLEDLGFFCVDNLPPTLIPKFAELCAQSGRIDRVALGIDIRGGEFFDSAVHALKELEEAGFRPEVLFLEADDALLVRRFKETRRRHPLAEEGRVLEGIREERSRLAALRQRADFIIDTTDRTPLQLRQEMTSLFGTAPGEQKRLFVTVTSFGFKHGLPLDADLVFDVRFLPNPHYDTTLRPLTGKDEQVRDYVLKTDPARLFLRRLEGLMRFLLPQYVAEGKTQLAIAIGCTGGRHRSVAVAERLAEALRRLGYPVVCEHRDIAQEEPDS